MYHYVREYNSNLPYLRYLHVENFKKQLEYFKANYNIFSLQELIEVVQGNRRIADNDLILTFDDAFIDHYNYVYPILERNNWVGIFYVPTVINQSNEILNVHKVHHLLAKKHPQNLLSRALELIENYMLDPMSSSQIGDSAYQSHDSGRYEKDFKKLINYQLLQKYQTYIIELLFKEIFPEGIKSRLYLNRNEICEMHSAGMIIGSHGVRHLIMSRLEETEQRDELKESFATLSDIIPSFTLKTFCYPFGHKNTYNDITIRLLNKENCVFSFCVEGRDITHEDWVNHRQELARYDCNAFPFGKATIGDHY